MTPEELQELIVKGEVSTSTLLERAMIVASGLGDTEFAAWAQKELVGYECTEAPPTYRTLPGNLVALAGGKFPIPSLETTQTKRQVRFPIGDLETHIRPGSTSNCAITIDSSSVEFQGLPQAEKLAARQVTWAVEYERSTLIGLFNVIRQRILSWTLEQGKAKPSSLTNSEPILDGAELWLLRYLDKHCESPNESGAIPFKKWTINNLPTEGHAFEAVRAIMMIDCDDFEQLLVGLKRRGYVGAFKMVASFGAWITAFGQDYLLRLENTEETTMSSVDTKNVRRVFIVQGRNATANKAMCKFLRAMDLSPIEFDQLTTEIGGSPYVGDVIKKGFTDARAAVVLLTPDDEARLKAEFRKVGDSEKLVGQARQNVLIEAGMALALDEARTIIVAIGDVKIPSDIEGLHIVYMDNSPAMRNQLAGRLKTAGCQVNRTGSDWLAEGDFEGCCKKENRPQLPSDPIADMMGMPKGVQRRMKPGDVGQSRPDQE